VAPAIRVGTCSFADEALTALWYPRGIRSGEERLRYYAKRFDTVEIDATYYTLPAAEITARWAERTPPGFVFHVKAFGLMTRHPVRLEQLPPDLRDHVDVGRAGRVEHPSREVREEVFARFHEALEPLRTAGKLGGVLMQFPPYVVPRPESYSYLEWAQDQLGGDEMLVEFRHRSWVDDEHRAEVLGFLEERGATMVVVDAPRSEAKNLIPTVVAATSQTAYVRMHGRNAATWNTRAKSAAERFDYLYSERELTEWIEPLRELSAAGHQVFVFFNNNGRSAVPAEFEQTSISGSSDDANQVWVAQAPENAVMLRRLLKEAGLPVSDPSEN
jgi:uncharacterized protein YecE (DUF72 family)